MNMRKIITTVVTAVVLLCANTVMVSADRSDEPCNKDYRKQPIYDVNGVEATKPIAEFKIKRLRNGELMDELLSDSGYDLDNPFPTMECYVGDTIVFVNTKDTEDTLTVTVTDMFVFKSFAELYDKLPLLKCGYTEDTVKTASPNDMELYYTAAEQSRYGVVGIEIALK